MMASYKQPCIHCKNLIDRDTQYCPYCGSHSPFMYHCPTCRKPISKNMRVCPGCNRTLYVECPFCHELTFVQERCEKCNQSLMVQCENKRCLAPQFFENTKCTACGKKIKAKLER